MKDDKRHIWYAADMTKILPTDSPFVTLVKSIEIEGSSKELSEMDISKDEVDELIYWSIHYLVYGTLPKRSTDYPKGVV